MNTASEETAENGKQRRKSISFGGGSNLGDAKTRRYSLGVTTTSRKSIEEEGNIVPNYLRASTGSCHDFCKFGKKHEHSKTPVPVKFKRTTIVNKDKVPKTLVPIEKKITTRKTATKNEIDTPVEPVKVTKKDVLLSSKKPLVYKESSSTNRKTTKNEVKTFNRSTSVAKSSPVVAKREGSNGGVVKKDVRTVNKTGIASKTGTVKKVVAKVTLNGSQSPKASISRAASLKAIKSRGVKQVTPLKDQNRLRKTERKQPIAETVQAKSLNGVEAESEVKHETMEFDFKQSSMGLVNPTVCNSSDFFSDKNEVEEESPIVHLVCGSSELFSDKEVVESSQLYSDKEIIEEALIAPPVSESSESFYDDEVLENESDYNYDEEAKVSEEASETANLNEINISEMEASVGNYKILRKGKMVISEDKDDATVKLRFRRGKILDLKSENNSPRRLKFRRRVIDGKEDGQNISRKTYKNKTLDLQNEDQQRASRRSFEKKYVEETNESNNGAETVVLKHQAEQEKKDAQGLLNNVIEETASKLVESRKSKVKALVGAFETVISLQDGKPSSG
ncbi:putative Calmodulin-binding domain, plant [Helianthus annuus]|nr:putative Calmodulin-binding domain, plant [Helianthus annuus]